MKVVVVALLLEIAEDDLRLRVRPVGKHDHVLAIVLNRMLVLRFDNERAVLPGLFLETAMAVIPKRAALADRKAVDEGLTRRDSGKAQARDAGHLWRRSASMPV